MKIDIILTAAGSSRRFGSINKLLYKIDGRELFTIALENAKRLKEKLPQYIDKIAVVSKYDEIKKICERYGEVEYIHNPLSHKGISASVNLGVRASKPENALMFMVCDQPYISMDTLVGLVRGYMASGKAMGCIVDQDGTTSNPCIFSPEMKAELLDIEGDRGGKSLIKKHKERVYFLLSHKRGDFLDIDVPCMFDFTKEKGHIISIVGGGGKTTLMYKLGEVFASYGFKTLLATTTKIYKPDDLPLASTKDGILEIWKSHKIALMGREIPQNKLEKSPELEECIGLADAAVIEADGAKGLPCKAPEEHEPVILEASDIVLGVVGIDALDKPVGEVCFRKEKVCALLNVDEGHIITEKDLADILSSESGAMKNVGGRKYYAIINKCDTAELKSRGEKIKTILKERGIKAYACSLKEGLYE